MESFDNGSTSTDAQTRQVARAACLNCRSAKRRCDGQQPVCGPCASRGVEEGGCNFVSSKRGGPRYKGVKGAEAARIKAERERQRTTTAGGAGGTKEKLKRDRQKAKSSSRSLDGQYGNGGLTDSESSHASTSPSSEWQRSVPASVLGTPSVHNSNFAQHSHVHGTGHSVFAPSSDVSSNALRDPTSSSSFMASPASAFPQNSNGTFIDALNYPPEYQQQQQQQQLAAAAAAAAAANITLPFGQPQHNLPMDAYIGGMGSGDLLSFANLELLQRMQEGTNAEQEKNQFADFFSQLEVLPKAGLMQNAVTMNPLDVLMEWEEGEVGGNVQDNELGVRTLLSDFYELVYPACPVLPSPGNLPSLAFYFSGKGPCGLFAALSAVVALHLPPDEAYKTLKASQHPLQQYAGSQVDGGGVSTTRSPVKSNEDVAAYHAKTSEFILHQYTEHKRTCFLDPTALNPFDGMDEELITIEAGAAHTLLCLYYYGSGKPLGHQRAYKHAVEGWELMQKLDLHSKASWESEQMSNSSRPFANQIKLEWAKRVYWCSYTAATVMSCTGGFEPFGNPKDGALDLQLRPSLEDVSAWGVMVRGAQHVSRCYRLLFELDQLRSKLELQGYPNSAAELQQANAERQSIFGAMLKLDMEISNYTRFDAGWRDPAPEAGDEGFKTADKELARSLKAAGRLMTSGAIIILHRAQAFSNARVFMEPQCGIPEASQMNRTKKYGVDSILHHAMLKDLPPPRMATAAQSPPSVLGRTSTAGSAEVQNQQSPMAFGQAQPQSTQVQAAAAVAHPFLTDRFNGGPFEPAHSLERCRFAASTMVGTLPRILNSSSRVPKLPPYSACSFVLGSYAILMLTLLIQIRGEMEANGQAPTSQATSADYGATKVNNRAELKMQLELHRAPVRDIIVALRKFATVWHKAASYESEVSTLLAANKILG